MWKVWDKISNINALTAAEFLARNTHLVKEEVIFIKMNNDRVVQVEGKSILAKLYEIDVTLDNDAFIAKYEEVLAEIKKAAENTTPYDPYTVI